MPSPPADATPLPRLVRKFVTTQWSVVLAAGDASAPNAGQALQSLSEGYWYPLYAFARRRGASAEDAADLTQEFFARLIEGEFLRAADPQKGKFRTFLLTVFQRFLASDHQKRQAARRGGGRTQFSIDAADGELRYAMEPLDVATPEMLFERRWAMTLLQRVLQRLEEEYRQKGKAELFAHCRDRLTGTGAEGSSCAETAASLRMSEVAVRVAVHRMRKRYRELVQLEVADTVNAPQDVEEELQALRMAILGAKS
jgi:RNA polymerase sigma factor (sigma-70 family)